MGPDRVGMPLLTLMPLSHVGNSDVTGRYTRHNPQVVMSNVRQEDERTVSYEIDEIITHRQKELVEYSVRSPYRLSVISHTATTLRLQVTPPVSTAIYRRLRMYLVGNTYEQSSG